MASVAYNFMVADPNSHSRRYNEHNCGHDPRRSSSVTIDLVSDTGTGTHVVKRRKSRKKSTAIVVVKERVSISILVYSSTSKTVSMFLFRTCQPFLQNRTNPNLNTLWFSLWETVAWYTQRLISFILRYIVFLDDDKTCFKSCVY